MPVSVPNLLIDEENVFRALLEVAHLSSGNPFCSRTRLFIMLCLTSCSFSETILCMFVTVFLFAEILALL